MYEADCGRGLWIGQQLWLFHEHYTHNQEVVSVVAIAQPQKQEN